MVVETAREDIILENAEWDEINDITSQLVRMMDSLVDPDMDHVLARRALARSIANMRADKSAESDQFFAGLVARQLLCFKIIDAGVLA
ncbi:MAG: hypothetical protein Q6373_016015 [Candidatus Sigynarchaeota archaeon]